MTELHIPKITTAQEIAVLVKAIDIDAGAALIQQYADCVAASAKCEATDAAYERWDAMMRDTMAPRPSKEEFAEVMQRVAGEMADA